jgi:hypothetical protein
VNKSFIEWVSISAREPVFSAALAWIFTEDSPLPLVERLAALGSICGAGPIEGRSITCKTEYEDVDVLVTVERPERPLYMGIENKIKAVEGKNQLAVYDRHLDALDVEAQRVFLTLTGEQPASGRGWKAVSYSAVVDALRRQPSSTDRYVADLCNAMTRLVQVAQCAVTDSVLAAVAFGDEGADERSELGSYLKEMKLHGLVQRLWMGNLASTLRVRTPWRLKVGETRGQAFFEVKAALNNPHGCDIGLQVQHRAIKIFCAPARYGAKAKAAQHEMVERILFRMPRALGAKTAAKFSRTGKLGFRSFTIRQLPEGRNLDAWARRVQPYVRKLQSVYGDVTARNGD